MSKKQVMKLNILQTETGNIDLPKDFIYRAGDTIVINDNSYLIDKVKFHIMDGEIFQITYVAFKEKREPLTRDQVKLLQSLNIPIYG